MKYVERLKACQPNWADRVDRLLDHLLPMHCVVCGMACEAPGICGHCRDGLPRNAAPCRSCGLPLPGDQASPCGPCLVRPPPYQRTVAPLRYEFPVRQLVRQFKFRRDLAAGRVLASLLSEHLAQRRGGLPDCLVPVPLHGYRLFRRGFNQAFDIARQVSRDHGVPIREHDLRRTRPTRAQAGLDAGERRRNLRNAFAWHGASLRGLHVALVDDVMTTGATIGACAVVLKKAGAARVDAWVLARAVKTP